MDKEQLDFMTDNIVIPKYLYESLVACRREMNVLLNAIFGTSTLSYDKDSLYFDDRCIDCVLKGLFTDSYEKRLKELKEENRNESADSGK